MKCKNCGQPIEKMTEYIETGFEPYWRHIRESHTGRLWCYPTTNMTDMHEFYVMAAQPEE